jgi:hypothetical protein
MIDEIKFKKFLLEKREFFENLLDESKEDILSSENAHKFLLTKNIEYSLASINLIDEIIDFMDGIENSDEQ